MGLDLSLLPVEGHGDVAYARTVLKCARRPGLFEALAALEKQHGSPVLAGFKSLLSRQHPEAETRYGLTDKTPYGERRPAVAAGELAGPAEHPEVRDNPENRAVWAYPAHLQHDQPVALFWHPALPPSWVSAAQDAAKVLGCLFGLGHGSGGGIAPGVRPRHDLGRIEDELGLRLEPRRFTLKPLRHLVQALI